MKSKMTSKVHKIRFYNPKPKSINCICYNKVNKQVAIARDDASIEIWDISYAPYLLKFIPGVEKGSVEALGWANERLLSTGLGGSLIEWDLNKLSLKTTVLLTGYAAWCLDINNANTLVAVGTEQGYINLFSLENNEIVYKKLFDKQEGRILCCKFDYAGNILITGSVDTIRVWNVVTGQAMCRMSARRRGMETIVWSLGVLSDNTIVTGESNGRLTFWDISTGDQIESFTTHKSDILSVVVSDDEKSIYCSGVDPIIVNFIKVCSQRDGKWQWVRNVQRHIHEHDVRGLALQGSKLISVGVDGYMTFSSFPPKWVMRIPPMLPSPRSSVSTRKKLILLKYSNYLEVWKLGSYATNENGQAIESCVNVKQSQGKTNSNLEHDSAMAMVSEHKVDQGKGQSLQLTENALKLVSIQSKGKKQIRCSALSPNGELIIYATDTDLRMLKLETDDDANTTSLSKVLISGVTETTCDLLAFTDDSRHVALHCSGSIRILQVDPEAGATIWQTIETTKYFKTAIIHLVLSMTCPSEVTYLVAADSSGDISVWSRLSAGQQFKHYYQLPKHKCVPSAITVDHIKESILVVYVDQKLLEFNLVKKIFNNWVNHCLPPEWYSRKSAVRSVTFHPHKNDVILFQDETSLWILGDNTISPSSEPQAKRRVNYQEENLAIRIIPIKYLSDFHWLDGDEAVVVEQLPETIVSQLPAVMQMKRPPYVG